jgi:N-acetylglucosamine kinase-like BadF-type ATPase
MVQRITEMYLIADSGSTKTEWKVLKNGEAEHSLISSGINPFFLSDEEIYTLLVKELPSLAGRGFSGIWFYGTGINSPKRAETVRKALSRFAPADDIFIGSDLLGAARSLCLNEPGIACIMGTGSNSCYYNGKVIAANVSPLGYILGDEGGAAVLGRKLVAGVLKKQVPQAVIDRFFETYKLTPADILENVYMKPFPNRFLGQFSKFISANIEVRELQFIITSSFDEFIIRNILQYPEAKNLPVHFTGSIAWHFRNYLEERLERYGLKPGNFSLTPMANLVKYHLINLQT